MAPAVPTAAATPSTKSTQPTAPATQAPAAQATTKINVNTADAATLQKLPNVGSRMTREFMEYRPYSSILQFRQEIGKYVDAAQVADYEKLIYVPVLLNQADTDTLQQLPGVDKAVADKLIAARPYAGKAAFVKKLTELTSADQAAAAGAMVEGQ